MEKRKLDVLKESIFYCNMTELRQFCERLGLPKTGQKRNIIDRILEFVETGKIIDIPEIPSSSRAKKGQNYPLKPDTLILFGNYKNDLKTRQFLKTLVGNHFHFTAFGQDWTKERWFAGNPPTYAEFAKYWQQEYLARKNKKASPKKEWALLNFTQRYLAKKPTASRSEISREWKAEREKNAKIVKEILFSKLQFPSTSLAQRFRVA